MIAFLIAQETAKNPSALLTSKIKEFQPNPRRLRRHCRTSSHTLPAPSSRTRKPGASSSSVVLWQIHGRVLFTKPPFHPADKIPDFNLTQHTNEQRFILPVQRKAQQWLHADDSGASSVSVGGIPVAILVQARRYCSS